MQPFQSQDLEFFFAAGFVLARSFFSSFSMSSDAESTHTGEATKQGIASPQSSEQSTPGAGSSTDGLGGALAGLLVQLQTQKSGNKDHIDNQLKVAQRERIAAAKAAKAANTEKRRLDRKRKAAIEKCAKHSTAELLEALRIRLNRQEVKEAKKRALAEEAKDK